MIATTSANTWNLDLSAKLRLAERIRQGNPVLTFSEDPALASLCTCLALEREVGNPEFDRLSPFFGVLPPKSAENPWNSEIFAKGDDLGIRFTRRDGKPLQVRHADFAKILAPESLGDHGELQQVVIYPNRVAVQFRARGFELVIVRDWILASALDVTGENRVSYLLTNEWEIRQNIARQQVDLMTKRQLPFFGTHDVVDHLLGADADRYDHFCDLFLEVQTILNAVFADAKAPSRRQLIVSYLIGVLLDDLAQPKWYGSSAHAHLVRSALSALQDAARPCVAVCVEPLILPPTFHSLVEALRGQSGSIAALQIRFDLLLSELTRSPVQFRNDSVVLPPGLALPRAVPTRARGGALQPFTLVRRDPT